jgi:alkylhydroperoxidase/carboxymuconolactone decarboxylase family protein YurZ
MPKLALRDRYSASPSMRKRRQAAIGNNEAHTNRNERVSYMSDDEGVARELQAWLERHAKELGLPSVPEKLKRSAEQYPVYTLNYIRWRDSVIMTEGVLSKKQKLLIALGAVTPTLSEAAMVTYARLAIVAGATKEEVVEAMYVATVFTGGPGLVALGNVMEAMDK